MTSPLQPEQLHRMAQLARLHLSKQESLALESELARLLHWIEELKNASVEGIEPMAHPMNISLPLRQDNVTETDQSQALLALAPETQSGFYLVPKVIA